MDKAKLETTAKAMVAQGKGILAADESTGTIGKRFDGIGVENVESNRQTYRNFLFTAEGVADYIGGVIMYDETVRQSTDAGVAFPTHLKNLGIEPGIKVDMGAKPMADHPGETLTAGLDGLAERLAEYADMGLTFAKWRAVITIGESTPTDASIDANADALAQYGALCQEAGIVPIIEPEVLMDGTHTVETCREVTERTLIATFKALEAHNVYLPGMILKPNMIVAGSNCPVKPSVDEVATQTVDVLIAHVPTEVTGIAFLSGGQSELDATAHLNAMNALSTPTKPWPLTFSYGRALQAASLKAWSGHDAQISDGQNAFMHRAKMNGAAMVGQYDASQDAA